MGVLRHWPWAPAFAGATGEAWERRDPRPRRGRRRDGKSEAAPGRRLRRGLGFLAGAEPDDLVERAEVDQRGHQRHDADPAPDVVAGVRRDQVQGIGDQHKADDDAEDAVDAANVLGHFGSPFPAGAGLMKINNWMGFDTPSVALRP